MLWWNSKYNAALGLFYYTSFSCNTVVILLELQLLIDLKITFTGHKYIYHLTCDTGSFHCFFTQFQNLTQGQRGHEGPASRNNAIRPPVPSPVNVWRKGKNSGPIQNNLRLLRETHRFRNNLKGDDLSWEAWATLQDQADFDTTGQTGCPFASPSLPNIQMDSGIGFLSQHINGLRKRAALFSRVKSRYCDFP